MPTVKGGTTRGVGQSKQSGYHTKEQIEQTSRPARARDNVSGAFAGNENEAFEDAENKEHSTSVKSRDRKAMSEKTPKI